MVSKRYVFETFYLDLIPELTVYQYERARVVVAHKKERSDTPNYDPVPQYGTPEYEDYMAEISPPSPLPGQKYVQPDKIGSRSRIPGCQCDKCQEYNLEHQKYMTLTFSNYDKTDPTRAQDFSDHQYFICHSHLYAFILKDREYGKASVSPRSFRTVTNSNIIDLIDVERVEEPKISINAIDHLVMKTESNKALIKAICDSHAGGNAHDKPFFADFIQGKGEGQIFLLHGPPGTGKTLTAGLFSLPQCFFGLTSDEFVESVAEFTKRPLLTITGSDLGHEPARLEDNLLTFFQNANDWGAIVLLDEADVYLERRSSNDFSRNSIVSSEASIFPFINCHSSKTDGANVVKSSCALWTTSRGFFFLPQTVLVHSTRRSCRVFIFKLDTIHLTTMLGDRSGTTISESCKKIMRMVVGRLDATMMRRSTCGGPLKCRSCSGMVVKFATVSTASLTQGVTCI
jgi:hypothetical protein